ncbi:MAG: hypothetical protein GAK37_01183 [Pseudomonas sp.]|nr:MAG: hypothetical protein GAK37_01183 [Pseudomonas sp.]
MKDYAGQRRFQAPVADDFAKGLLAPGQAPDNDDDLLKPMQRAVGAVLKGIGTFLRG